MHKEKDQLYILSQELLSTRAPYPSYPVFLFEQFIWFKLKAVKEGRPYEMETSAQFLETFMESNFIKQNLLCEIYLHEMACPLDHHSNPTPYLGDVQLRDFSSFVSNHVQWERTFQTFSHNVANTNLWIWSETQSLHLLLAFQQQRLTSSIISRQMVELQERVISICVSQISMKQ